MILIGFTFYGETLFELYLWEIFKQLYINTWDCYNYLKILKQYEDVVWVHFAHSERF